MGKLRYESPAIRKLNAGGMNKFGTRTEYEPVTHIDGVAVADIMAAHGSPVFVLSERMIRNLYRLSLQAFATRYPKVQFAWSYKTNYLDAVCRIFHQEGSWAEVVSGFEYEKALGNGVPGHRILFNGPEKTEAELRRAVELDSLIHIDHFDELYQLTDIAAVMGRKPRVAIRVNMDTGTFPLWDRFGFNYENGQAMEALTRIVSSGRLELTGLHCHIGTYMMSVDAYRKAIQKLGSLALHCRNAWGINVRYIDIGGGFPSGNQLRGAHSTPTDALPSIDEYAEAITDELQRTGFAPDSLPLLMLETGRALIDEAGYLLGTVLATKRLSDGRRANIMDFGVNILFTSFWYEHRISPAQPFSHHSEDVTIYGPLCMNIDMVRQHASLPLLNRGDRVVVHNVGAYNMTQWMQFIQMRPRVVLIDEQGAVHLIREAEDLAFIKLQERIPPHLADA